MTRENKLALVIGFGLILFIGILISDHFSVANNQATADLTRPPIQEKPLVRDPQQMVALVPEIYENRPAEPAPSPESAQMGGMTPPAAESSSSDAADRTAELLAMQAEAAGEPSIPPRRPQSGQPMPTPGREYRTHQLADDETLTAVSLKYYNTAKLVNAIARFNGIADPNKVRAGHRLNVPDLDELIEATGDTSVLQIVNDTAPPRTTTEAAQQPAYTSYEIKRGDILSKLASKYMGTGNRWRELYELNKHVIDDPHKLKEGTVIRVPVN